VSSCPFPRHPSPLRIALIGAGVRGSHLARQAARAGGAVITAVAEPDPARRRLCAREHGIGPAARFDSWQTLCASAAALDGVIVATLDNQHTGPVLASLGRGWHVLTEKPLADTLADCRRIVRAQQRSGCVVSVCHTLRHLETYRRIRQTVRSGDLGRLIHIEHMEAIGHLRFAHNYVRGRWARQADNTFLLLHKCCHDLDFLAWLTDSPCVRVASFGALTHFRPENAPEHSASRCLACRLRNTCLYSAPRLYLDADPTGRRADLGPGSTRAERLKALRHGPYGACVWRAGNDVVDHQVVALSFADGATATCVMTGFSATHGRRTRVQGTRGELRFDEAEGTLTLHPFGGGPAKALAIPPRQGYHPEDREIVSRWLAAIRDPAADVAVDAREALRTHAIAFAAEQSRLTHRLVAPRDADTVSLTVTHRQSRTAPPVARAAGGRVRSHRAPTPRKTH